MMMDVSESSVHIGWQYIHFNGIWQEFLAPDFIALARTR